MRPPARAEGYVFAGFWPRLGAMLVDVLLALVWGSAFRPAYQRLFPDPPVLGSFTVSTLLVAAVFWAYFVVTTAAAGSTLGKRAFGLRVVSIGFEPPDWGTAFFREVVGRIIVAGTAFIGYVWLAVDYKKQGWHDKIADTYVLKRIPAVLVQHAQEQAPVPPVESPAAAEPSRESLASKSGK